MASTAAEVGQANVVSHAEWLAARTQFLKKKKSLHDSAMH